jgi:hypothetical protein
MSTKDPPDPTRPKVDDGGGGRGGPGGESNTIDRGEKVLAATRQLKQKQVEDDEKLARSIHDREQRGVTLVEQPFMTKLSAKASKAKRLQEREEQSGGEKSARAGRNTNNGGAIGRRQAPPTSNNTGNQRTYVPTPVQKLLWQIRDRCEAGAPIRDTLGLYSSLQRKIRSQDDETKMEFAHVFHERVPAECAILHKLLCDWMRNEQLYRRPKEFLSRLAQIQFVPIFEAKPVTPTDWLNAVTQSRVDPSVTAGANMAVDAGISPGIKKFAKVPRAMTEEERTWLEDLVRGIRVARTLPDFCYETLTPMVHGLISDSITINVRGKLIIQLSSSFNMSPDITYQGKLRQLFSTAPSEQQSIESFKKVVTHIEFDSHERRLIFTILSKQIAKEWHQKHVSVRGRLQQLLMATDNNGEEAIAGAIDITEYEISLNVQHGILLASDIRNIFVNQLSLDLISCVQAGTDPQGMEDPNY